MRVLVAITLLVGCVQAPKRFRFVDDDRVTRSYVIDEHARTIVETVAGRRWTYTMRGSSMIVTSDDGHVDQLECKPEVFDVAPATATFVAVPANRLVVSDCWYRSFCGTGVELSGLMLASQPIEIVLAGGHYDERFYRLQR